jgi:hypothetical protein
MDSWLAVAGIDAGVIFRCVSRTGHVWGSRLSEKAVWWVVREYAKLAGIDHLAPMTFAELAPAYVTPLEVNLNRSSFYSATGPSKPPNDTSVRGRD